jgi:acyl-ACP thioesterase
MKDTNFWEYRFKVRSFDVDRSNFITATAISEYLQEIAGEHANNIGFGYRQVIKQQMVWVLNGIRIEAKRLPRWEEEVLIQTWVVENNRFLSRRDFRWLDREGNILLNATTNWILFHTEKRRPQLVEQMNFPLTMKPDQRATDSSVQNIKIKEEVSQAEEYRVKYSDLDMVGHMNNTKYIQAIMDTYTPDFHNRHKIKVLDINFKAEARFGDLLLVSSRETEENVFVHQLMRSEDNKVNCLVKLAWR